MNRSIVHCLSLAVVAILAWPGLRRAEPAANPTPELEVVPLDEDSFALEHQEAPSGSPDPLESSNRRAMWVDQQIDRWFVDPLVRTYQFIVPPPGRRAVRRFTLNLNSVSILINDLLQREWGDAAVTTERFAINSTVGIGGIFDPAAALGMERHHSDFGQTLALLGVGSGPYLVVPLFGPSNARDSGGTVVDFFLQPMLYILPFAQLFVFEGSLGLSTGLAARDAYSEGIASLRSSSVDYYSALRNAYYQTRTAEIWDRRDAHRPIAGQEPAKPR
jgi:phospholipid-binding lipoprotein MlaA